MSIFRVLAGLLMVLALGAGAVGCATSGMATGSLVMLGLLIPAGVLHNVGDRSRARYDRR